MTPVFKILVRTLDHQPSSLSMLVTLSYGENWFLTRLAALLWVISILLMLCFVLGTRLGRHTRLEDELIPYRKAVFVRISDEYAANILRSALFIVFFGVVHASVRPFTLFVCLEPYLSTYLSDLIHSWYK